MGNYSYLDWWWVSTAACAIVCLAALYRIVPRFEELTPVIHRDAAIRKKKEIVASLPNGFWRSFRLVLVTLYYGWRGLVMIAIAFVFLTFTAFHALINFIAHIQAVGSTATLKEELANGVLGLRLSSLIMLAAWIWSYHWFSRSDPTSEERKQIESAGVQSHAIEDEEEAVRMRKMETQTSWFPSDNELRRGLSSLRYGTLPRHVFQSQILHVGFLASALMFSMISIGTGGASSSLQSLLNWSISFAAHDVGLAFSYAYMLKGRLLGFHRLRVLLVYLGIAVIMTIILSPIIWPALREWMPSQLSLTDWVMAVAAVFALLAYLSLLVFIRKTERPAEQIAKDKR